jgi:hypothetical protein
MNSNELRIGNFINTIKTGVSCVSQINKKSFFVDDFFFPFSDIDNSDSYPIQLTEEWLIFSHNNNTCSKKIQFVHELQNLYYLLTNKELKLYV